MKQRKLHISFNLDIGMREDDKIRKPALKEDYQFEN